MSDSDAIVVVVVWAVLWVVPWFVAMNIWQNKGGSAGIGFLMGFFLGWIGVIIAAVATPSAAVIYHQGSGTITAAGQALKRPCTHCKEEMRRDARVCPHCGLESAPWVWHEGYWWVTNDNGSQYYLNDRTNEWVRHEKAPIPPS